MRGSIAIRRASRPLLALLALLGGACRLSPGSAHIEAISLRPGVAYVRALPGDGAYEFRFRAAAGRFFHLDVDQRGVDVVVLLRDPSGRQIYEVDSPTGPRGPEDVVAVATRTGEYRLVVEPFDPGARGLFALEVLAVRPATLADRAQAAAAASFARAERWRLAGNPAQAAAAYRHAVPLLVRSGEPAKVAAAQWHLGQELVELGRWREARADLEQAVAGLRSRGDGVGEARALNDLGNLLRQLGEAGLALAAHQRALSLYRKAANLSGTATSLNDLGLVLETQGDLETAIHRFQEALSLWRRLNARSPAAATLENLGSLYSLLGYDEEALDLLKTALRLLAGADPSRRASALLAVGWAEYLAGRPGQALSRYDQALALVARAGSREQEAGIWDRRGSALKSLQRYADAEASYEQALALSRASGSRLDEGHTLANLGWLDLERGRAALARQRLEEAVLLLSQSGDRNGEVYARVGLSGAQRRLRAFGPARIQAETAVHLVERMRSSLVGPARRGQFVATRFDAYEELVSVLMDLDASEPGKQHDREALAVAERARARNLLEELAAGRREPTTEADRARRRSLLAEIREIEQRRQTLEASDPADPRIEGLNEALRARWLDLDRLTGSRGPRAAPAPAGVAEMQALADDRSLLVVYMLAEPRSFAWTVDRRAVAVHLLPGRDRIERLARRVLAGLSQGPGNLAPASATRALDELSQAILAPLAARLRGRTSLAILPDGALHLVPFAALPSPADDGPAGDPLVARHEITTLASATVLRWQRQRLAHRPLASGIVAALGEPLYSRADPRLRGQAAPPQAGAATASRDGESFDPGALEHLPYTADEAKAIVRLAPPGRSLLALGAAASRELVESGALRRYRYLHFAAHGLLDPVLPERSGIALSRFDARGRPEDGFLSAPRVAALDLPADLAVLSGCQTGLGREVRGEGLVGLTQAFFRAGTRRVLVSLWKVRDRATAELMTRFYRALLVDRLAPAAALRAAQLSLRREPRWSAPYYWAGFSLQGDWR